MSDAPASTRVAARRLALVLKAQILMALAMALVVGPIAVAPAALADGSGRPGGAGARPGSLDPPDPYFPALGNRGYDVEHYDLAIAYDPDSDMLRGDTRIRAIAGERLTRFNLDLTGFDVSHVDVDGRAASFRRAGNELLIHPRARIASGTPFTVRVRYSGVPTTGQIPGLGVENGWLASADGATTLSEPDGASRWFPANDHPTDKATFTFRLDVPTPLTAAANGVLETSKTAGNRTVWTWQETAPMAPYLAQVSLGGLELRDELAVDGIAIRNAFGPAVAGRAASAASATPEMLRFLAGWFGPYPFSTYGVMVLDDVPRGLAFEAQTFSLLSPDLFRDPEYASAILAHELAHQWFGDWVSPAAWDETWLSEGFATYAEWLWQDHALGIPLQDNVDDAVSIVGRSPNIAADDPGRDQMFGTAPYERGGLTVHALRLEVGDEQFAGILRGYLARFGGATATTEDLVRVASGVAGRDLTDVFRSWLGPGPVPSLPGSSTPVGSTPPTVVALT